MSHYPFTLVGRVTYGFLVACTLILFFSGRYALAEPVYDSLLECAQVSTPNWQVGYQHVNYYVHNEFADLLAECSQDPDMDGNFSMLHATGIIKNAAEIWNSQSRSSSLIYRGHSSNMTFDEFCDDSSIETPAVHVVFRKGCSTTGCDWHYCPVDGRSADLCDCVSSDDCSGQSVGFFRKRVSQCPGKAQIEIFSTRGDTPTMCGSTAPGTTGRINWTVKPGKYVDENDNRERNLLTVLLHEFGHALKLGHPSSSIITGNRSVMHSGNDNARHLYTWDKDCVSDAQISDSRYVEYFWRGYSGNTWSSIFSFYYGTSRGSLFNRLWRDARGIAHHAAYFSQFQDYPVGHPNYAWEYGWSGWGPLSSTGASTYSDGDMLHNQLQTADTMPFLFQRGANPADGVRISYTWDRDSSDPHPPELRYRRSTDFWSSHDAWGRYHRCIDSGCISTTALRSSVPLVGAYDPYSNTDIMVSVLNTDSVNGGIMMIHPGFQTATRLKAGSILFTHNTTLTATYLNPLFDYSFLTDFAPGVACAPDRSEFDYNCLIAWNDRMVPNGRIHYTYFRINGAGQVEWHGTAWTRGGSYTASHISAGYFSDRFWLGWKDWTNPQKVAWTYNNGSYSSWSQVERLNRPRIVDPPSFAYDPEDPGAGGRITWTEVVD